MQKFQLLGATRPDPRASRAVSGFDPGPLMASGSWGSSPSHQHTATPLRISSYVPN